MPHPLRLLQRVGYATAGIEIRGIPPFAKKREGPFPTARPQLWQRVRLSFKESRIRFVDPTRPYRKTGGSPTIAFALAGLSAAAPFREDPLHALCNSKPPHELTT